MKSPRGLDFEQPIEKLTEEIALRSFLAICKIAADGLPLLSSVGSEAWRASTTSRALTDQEAKAAAQIAIWIEDAGKDIARRLLVKPKRRGPGRPKKLIGLAEVKFKQPLSERHRNFGEKKAAFDKQAQMMLVAMVSRENGRNYKEKLEALLKRHRPGAREARIAQEVRTKWAPRLSNARKNLTAEDQNMIDEWLEYNK